MASPQNSVNFPHPPPPPTPSSPDSDTTVVVVVFVSFGCLFFLAFLLVALCCFIKRKKKKSVQETDIVRADEHMKVKEAVVPGPHGTEAVILTIEDDVHIEEEIRKNELKFGKGMHPKSDDNIVSELGAASSSSGPHHDEHKS